VWHRIPDEVGVFIIVHSTYCRESYSEKCNLSIHQYDEIQSVLFFPDLQCSFTS